MNLTQIAEAKDPVLRNLQITQCYHELALAFAARLGGNANWCAFATWASKQAGRTIRGEDLRRQLVVRVKRTPAAQHLAAEVVSYALAAGARLGREQLHEMVWQTVDPERALERASDAVARGNLKVFAEIAPVFARFNSDLLRASVFDETRIRAWCEALHPGEPPDGQRYLRQAFTHYYQALFETDGKARTELLFLANLEVGCHEQTRLQPEIAEALDIGDLDARTVTNRLIALIFPHAGWIARLRLLFTRLWPGPTPLERAVAALVAEIRSQVRQILSAHVLVLGLPGGSALPLGRDLRGAYPASLEHIANVDLLALLGRIDPTPDSVSASGARDWSDLPERLHFICDFFRCEHERPDLFMPPFSAAQTAAIRSGRVPPGDLE